MDDELERFIRERKERVAQDRAGLEQDPPYMEVAVRVCVCVHACVFLLNTNVTLNCFFSSGQTD